MSAEAHGLRSQLTMLLLAALEDGALHAAAVREALRQASKGQFELSDGTVSPALRRLVHLGLP
jgi:DNA-binding PadR family transcriptional regulator